MLRQVTAGLLGIAALGFAVPAMAAPPVNPWQGTQTDVPVNINVNPMIELYTDVTPVNLQIVDAGENQGSTQAVGRVLHHLHNVGVDVSAQIDTDIPDNTQFHILINPAAVWATPGASGASKTISWRREGGVYIGADGGFPNQTSSLGTGSGNAVLAFHDAANAPSGNQLMPIQYFADARNVMPAIGSAGFHVVWTIAENDP
jgi:hypothetical protein